MTAREINFRIGHGYDAHRLTEGRKLIMGGCIFPGTRACWVIQMPMW